MIKLKSLLLQESIDGHQAILTSNPVKLYFTTKWEDRHVDIISRLFPKEMEHLTNEYENHGYSRNDEEGDNDALYMAANYISKNNHIARIIIEYDNKLYFNTDNNTPLTDKQLSYLKNYCIENNLELFQDLHGRQQKAIDLLERI